MKNFSLIFPIDGLAPANGNIFRKAFSLHSPPKNADQKNHQ
jgi:hypothetical protein